MDFTPQTEFEQRPVNFPVDYDPTLNGIGGWLVLVIIGQIVTILIGITDITGSIQYLGYNQFLDSIFYIIFAVDVLLYICLSGLILYFIFSRNIIFRKLLVISVVINFIYITVINFYLSSLGTPIESSDFFRAIVSGAVWILYLYKSKRVKNTYIYPKLYPNTQVVIQPLFKK